MVEELIGPPSMRESVTVVKASARGLWAWLGLFLVLGGSTHASDACENVRASSVLHWACAALEAVNRADAKTLEQLMAPEFSLTSVSGTYYPNSREAMIGRWTAPSPAGTSGRSTLLEVRRVHQASYVGFVTGVIEDRTTVDGRTTCQTHSFTDIWERRRGRWVWLQSHESGAKDAPCVD